MIASEKLMLQRPGEQAFEITIEVGAPYQVGHAPETWACPASISSLNIELKKTHGNSSFQAICLATSVVLHHLQEFKNLGGHIKYPNGCEFPLEAYSVGSMVKMYGG